jgi:hypothetical protein
MAMACGARSVVLTVPKQVEILSFDIGRYRSFECDVKEVRFSRDTSVFDPKRSDRVFPVQLS